MTLRQRFIVTALTVGLMSQVVAQPVYPPGPNVLPTGSNASLVARGTTAQRPQTSINGMIRYNQTLNKFEWYEGGAWIQPSTIIGGGGDGSTMPTASHSSAGSAVFGFNFADATASGFAVTLPSAVGNLGRIIEIKKVDATANIVTATPQVGQTIDGAVSYPLDSPHQVLAVISDGVNWKIK